MPLKSIPTLLCLFVCMYSRSHAQIEVAHLLTKGLPGNGFGSYLNFGIPISDADDITIEGAFYYFSSKGYHLAFAPVLGGYRHTFDGTGTGLYVEPAAGYTWGGTDIQKRDANGFGLSNNGKEVDQKNAGLTGALGVGYIFQFPLNIGLRYTHIFVSGDPAESMISLRFSYVLMFGRRNND